MAYEDEQGTVPLLPFDSDCNVDIDDIFVNLELILKEKSSNSEKRVQLDTYNDIFCLQKKVTEAPFLRVLVKGGPGSGKTTLTSKIAYDWAQSTKGASFPVLSRYDLLFVLNMRYMDQEVSLVDAIFDQLLPSDSKVSKDALQAYIVENASKVAIILDGADEFPGKIAKSKSGRYILDVVCNKMLRECCVIVTTRPHMVNKVVEFCTQYCLIDVTGFSRPNVFQYVGRFFQVRPYTPEDEFYEKVISKEFLRDDEGVKQQQNEAITSEESDELSVDTFLKEIHHSESLFSLSCIPVILTMMCVLWRGSRNLPERIADLYHEVVHYFAQRWFEKQHDDSESDIIENHISKSLGSMALNTLLEDRLYFSAKEFHSAEVLSKSCSIGIILPERRRKRLHITQDYRFFHKTFQEYFAAFYWASLVDDSSQFKQYLIHITPKSVDSFDYILRFCCGLSEKAAEMIIHHVVAISMGNIISNNTCHLKLERIADKSSPSWSRGFQLLFESRCYRLVYLMLRWFEAHTIEIEVHCRIHAKADLKACFDYFLDCFARISPMGNIGYNALVFHFSSIPTNLAVSNDSHPVPGSDVSRMSKLAKCLCKHSQKKLLKITLDITTQFEGSIKLAREFFDMIVDFPFRHLHILLNCEITYERALSSIPSLYIYDSKWVATMLHQLGSQIGHRIMFPYFLEITSPIDRDLDISPLLNGFCDSSSCTHIANFRCNSCQFDAEAMTVFISKLQLVSLMIDQKKWKYINIEGTIPSIPTVREGINPLNSITLPRFLRAINLSYIDGFYLWNTEISNWSISALKNITTKLSCISLCNTTITLEGCQDLFSYLANKPGTNLRSLTFSGNQIGQQGALSFHFNTCIALPDPRTQHHQMLPLSEALRLLRRWERRTG
ncbi:uncharacterized protein [Amphiura filiformis]|uniref:uncharacterized protein n=1 Tax=Amphiura filiformis TaxID=82378 RepID=UPI003B225956